MIMYYKKINKAFRVCHIPQVGYDAKFHVYCNSLEEAYKIQNVLTVYDLFQFNNRIKGDYCNLSSIQIYDPEFGEWCDYYDTNGSNPNEIYEDDKDMQEWITNLIKEN